MDILANSGSSAEIALQLQQHGNLEQTKKNWQTATAATERTTNSSLEKNDSFDSEAYAVAQQFESLLVHSMLKSMRQASIFGDEASNAKSMYDDMLDQEIAKTMVDADKGMGIAETLYQQIRRLQPGPDSTAADQPVSMQDYFAPQATVNSNDAHPHKTTSEHLQLRQIAQELSKSGTTEHVEKSGKASETSLTMALSLWNKNHNALSETGKQFIEPLMPYARTSAQRLGTSPGVVLAIAALETGWGQSIIHDKSGHNSHNLFGIKATGSDNRYATTLTTEYIEGSPQKIEARFKTFNNAADAVDGFADFILDNPRYSEALKHGQNPERFIQELHKAGYATDPRYAEKAISIMRQITGTPLKL